MPRIINVTDGTPTPPDGTVEELGSHMYPDPRFINVFWVFMDGKWQQNKCGPATVYHPELQTCVHPWQYPETARDPLEVLNSPSVASES
jgi:Chitin binding Peritrophin-A domain